ncbi:MAG TPA: Clp protease N-terminal domain-containing protein [Acidimicrobiales bacterium]
MFERFSDQARNAVELARTEASRLGHGHVGTEHLLLGILAEGDTPAARALTSSGASLAGCRELAAEAVGTQSPAGPGADLRLTQRANRALERAARLALRRRDAEVETSHVLLSVLDVEGRAGQVLRGLAVDLTALRAAVDGRTPAETGQATTPAAEVPGANAVVPTAVGANAVAPRCGVCHADLADTLAHRVVTTAAGQPYLVVYCSACGTTVGAAPA